MSLYLDKLRKLNGNMLKMVACICMLIDHIGAGIIFPVYKSGAQMGILPFEQVNFYYKILRFIGRSAFPIFAFLLVEGFFHTKNRLRYALSLFIFALISEYPYDLLFNSTGEGFNYSCNVYFSLFIGLVTMWIVDYIRKSLCNSISKYISCISYVLCAMVMALSAYTAHYIHCDYSEFGIGIILIFYFFRHFEPISLLAAYFLLCGVENEFKAFPGFILLYFYNQKRGKDLGKLKYLFYIFYPVHLAILFLIRYAIYQI